MIGWIRKLFSRAQPSQAKRGMARVIRGAYDAAQTTDDNRKHWAWTDSLGARSANSPNVRKILRERARYESHENNSYAKGICLTLANDLIGTGPRLQILTDDRAANRAIEVAFTSWARAVKLADKLRTMTLSKTIDGEAFALFITNPALPSSVQLDLRLIEAEQVTTPDLFVMNAYAVDGIKFDTAGNPVSYDILKAHPGDAYGYVGLQYDSVPARSVIHWFRADRPGQARGVPELTAALPLFAQLRRFTLATIAAAETAADFAAILKTQQNPNVEPDISGAENFQTIEIEKRMMVQAPAGWDISQLKAEHPTTTYQMFKREILTEIARCLNVPYAIAANDTSDYNYAGGRLDFQTWSMALRVERNGTEATVLERIFAEWLSEATRIHGLLPPNTPAVANSIPHRWFWDERGHVDPQKEASALQVLLQCNGTTLAEHYAAKGQDWEDAVRQRATEVALSKSLGLTPDLQPAAPKAHDAGSDEQEMAQDETGDGEGEPRREPAPEPRRLPAPTARE